MRRRKTPRSSTRRVQSSNIPEGVDVDQARLLDLQRLEEMYIGLGPDIRRGEIPAINAGLKIMERRARLLGLDAETRTQVTNEPPASRPYRDESDEELDEGIRILAEEAGIQTSLGPPRTAAPGHRGSRDPEE